VYLGSYSLCLRDICGDLAFSVDVRCLALSNSIYSAICRTELLIEMCWNLDNKDVPSRHLEQLKLMDGLRSWSGREFQRIGPATEKAVDAEMVE